MKLEENGNDEALESSLDKSRNYEQSELNDELEKLAETFRSELKKAKEQGIHTCIDTSGATYNPDNAECVERFTELVKHTDLVMLDIKHIDSAAHKTLTGMDNKNILAFAKFLEEKNIALWIRHIILKGYTDKPDDLIRLGNFIGKLKNLKALDVLPYHTMGVGKYKQLNIPYPLEGVEALPIADAFSAKDHILEGIKQVRK
jgi:pyruvate formate lyase activating enzyme